MTKPMRATLLQAANIIDQYAEELRRSNVCNGAWCGAGVFKVRNEWAHMVAVAGKLRAAAKCS